MGVGDGDGAIEIPTMSSSSVSAKALLRVASGLRYSSRRYDEPGTTGDVSDKITSTILIASVAGRITLYTAIVVDVSPGLSRTTRNTTLLELYLHHD